MSTSYEIIDPSLHVMVDKASDQTTLINENHNLKNLNLIIVISSIVVISVSVIYHMNHQKKDE